MNSAIVGYTGFVGSNILRQRSFEHLYNSKNFLDMKDQCYDLIVFAAARAAKWLANSNAEDDLAHIRSLMEVLKRIKANKFVLISTVDVYKVPQNVYENSLTFSEDNHPYGKHRGMLEDFVRSEFECASIVRLPALFGQGIKKNVIYDFIHNNEISKIDSRGVFQFYNLDKIGSDINTVLNNNIPVLNVATEPVAVSEIYEFSFGKPFENIVVANPQTYNFRSKYSNIWNTREDGYLYSKQEILEDIKKFISFETKNNFLSSK